MKNLSRRKLLHTQRTNTREIKLGRGGERPMKDSNLFIEAHISDIHFGVIDPKITYKILSEQFTNVIANINDLDLVSINGDLFHHKFMGNSDAIFYALKFVDELVAVCRNKGCTLFILHGTPSHDANQTKLFYQYMNDNTVDVRVIETIRFEYVNGKKILCIPEIPGLGKEYYENILYTETYDSVCAHGTIRGAIYGRNAEDLDAPSPVFSMNNFILSNGPVIAGHVHVPGCYERDWYYCGSPIRWNFGEEQPKGFVILVHNTYTRQYYVKYMHIESFRYDTINIDDMIASDPVTIYNYLMDLKAQGIDNIRIELTADHPNINILRDKFRNDGSIKFKCDFKNDIIRQQANEASEKFKEYDYITDKNLSEYEILTRYINNNKGYTFITTDQLIDLLKE